MDTILLYLFYVFIFFIAVNSSYYLVFLKFAFSKEKLPTTPDAKKGVSVIICSKNEARNLEQYLPLWLEQDYPKLEFVLIDDASHDETAAVIKAFAKADTRIIPVYVENNEAFWGSKKYALTLGIKKAKYEHLLFSDADCYPKSNTWVNTMAAKFVADKQLVLGYGGYRRIKGSFLNMLIRYETVLTAIQYLGYAVVGRPYMGVGRNLGYTKSLFFEQRGFMGHMQVVSGDDDLFVNQAATAKNTVICTLTEAHTLSEPKQTWASWFRQKRRHVTTASHYKKVDQFLLGLFYISQLLIFLLAIVLFIVLFKWTWVLGALVLRYLCIGVALGGGIRKLDEKGLMPLFPVLELFLICTQLSIFSANLISKPNRWK